MSRFLIVRAMVAVQALLLCWSSVSFAESPPTRTWVREWNGPANHSDDATAALILADDSVLMAGETYTPSIANHVPALVRYDAQGVVLWSKVESVLETGFGDFRTLQHSVTGDVLVSGFVFLKNAWHVFVRKIDPANGATIWQMNRPAMLTSSPFNPAVVEDPATQTLLIAASRGNDFLVIRCALEDGAFINEHLYDGPQHGVDRATAVAPLANGGFVVCGPQNGSSDGYLTIAADAKGNVQWTDLELGPITNTFTPAWLGLDPHGDILVGGGPETPCGLFQFRAWKISAIGCRLWTVEWPTANCASAEPEDFAIASDGSLAMTGQSHNPFNLIVLHVAPDGTSWSRVWDGPAGGIDGGRAVGFDGFGNVIAAGTAGVVGGTDIAAVAWSSEGDLLFSRVDPPAPSGTDFVAGFSVGRNGRFCILSNSFTPSQNDNIFTSHYQRVMKSGDATGDGVVNVDDLLSIINAWGPCPPFPTPCVADVAPLPMSDAMVNVDDLLAVINEWG